DYYCLSYDNHLSVWVF
nr:immunoglobulin light chain junction region [Macaca mulatta]MOV97987.1 immunoglobulin light chain junction region [Macaca mulatta]MOV99150.1 immunoglobulin light chain junction region [Macaca mulatta]MOW00039.1 immunoglobulin light chain junction region [Macaca mulatta]